MRYSLKLLTAPLVNAVATVFLITLPIEAVVTDKPSVAKLSVASQEVKIAQVQGKEQRRDEALRLTTLGLQQLNRGEYREALNNFEQALIIFREIKQRKEESDTLNYIGLVYRNLGEYPKALDYYQQALAIYKQVGNKPGEGTILNNIGLVYRNLGEYPKALYYYQKSLAIKKQVDDKAGEGITLNNIGAVYITAIWENTSKHWITTNKL